MIDKILIMRKRFQVTFTTYLFFTNTDCLSMIINFQSLRVINIYLNNNTFNMGGNRSAEKYHHN